MILHLLRMRRNVNRNVFNDRENVSATTLLLERAFRVLRHVIVVIMAPVMARATRRVLTDMSQYRVFVIE